MVLYCPASLDGGKMAKVKMNIGGQILETEPVSWKTIDEPWSLYRLEDGSVIKLKLVISDVFKLPNADPLTGLPQYVVRSSNVMSVEAPEPPLSKREVH
jgi:hypothetical protein